MSYAYPTLPKCVLITVLGRVLVTMLQRVAGAFVILSDEYGISELLFVSVSK